jgi:hypothetical protein
MNLSWRAWICMSLTACLGFAGISAVCAGPMVLDTDFEMGLGHNTQPVGSSIAGLTFSSFDGLGATSDMYFADVTTGIYNATSGDGTRYENGEYFVGGNVAAFAPDLDWNGSIKFTLGLASVVGIGYSSFFDIFLDGYDAGGNMVAATSGPAVARSKGATGIGMLTLMSAQHDISYVVIRSQGGYWMVDNVSSDAPVPEPGSLLALAAGLAGMAGLVTGRRA